MDVLMRESRLTIDIEMIPELRHVLDEPRTRQTEVLARAGDEDVATVRPLGIPIESKPEMIGVLNREQYDAVLSAAAS